MYTISVAPASEPITTSEAKTHLKVDHSDDDTYIGTLITAAREYVERYTGRALMTQTIIDRYDTFPGAGEPLLLSFAPVQSVSSVGYYDSTNAAQTWSSAGYILDSTTEPPRISEQVSYSWPTVADRINAVNVTYVAGYTSAGNVPAALKHAIKLIIADMYENRESTVKKLPTSVEFILNPYRIWQF